MRLAYPCTALFGRHSHVPVLQKLTLARHINTLIGFIERKRQKKKWAMRKKEKKGKAPIE